MTRIPSPTWLLLPAVATLQLACAGRPTAEHPSPAQASVVCAGRDTGHTANGLYYECHGSGRDVVILIPAFSMDVRMWTPQIAPLSRLARVITYDTRGHGRSAPPSGAYSSVDDLAALMDELKVADAHLVGLSNGARIALDFALVHPARARSLVLASPGVSGFSGGDFSYMAPVIAAVRAGDLEKAAELWAATPLMHIPQDTAAAALVTRISRDNRTLWSYRTNPERPLTPPAIGRLGEVRVPTLVIAGENDLPYLRRLADSVARGIPGATLVVIPGVGHIANLAAPNEFNRAVEAFLRARD